MTLLGHTENSGTHTQKKKGGGGFFPALIHRRGECFNQPVIAFTKQDSKHESLSRGKECHFFLWNEEESGRVITSE